MQFKDAAYQILKQAGSHLHYNDITDRALSAGILTTEGQTPHATMGSRLYTDTLREDSRFRRAGQKGFFTLKEQPQRDILQQIEAINQQARKKLRRLVHQMDPQDFEQLIGELLVALGVDEDSVFVTRYSGDGGVDVRGRMVANGITTINVAVQAKRWKGNVGAGVVRDLRGSLKVHEQGILITPSDFTAAAKAEAAEAGKVRISLINGDQLIELMVQHKVGAYEEKYAVVYLDEERWQELVEAEPAPAARPAKPAKAAPAPAGVLFPLPVVGSYKDEQYKAELLGISGRMRYAGVEYASPSAAAKATGLPWKAVSGWNFWKYQDVQSGSFQPIGLLRKSRST